jgi:F0F1-type ATP synthase assembly protein I
MAMALGSAVVGLGSSGPEPLIPMALGGLVILLGFAAFVTGVVGQRRARPARSSFPGVRVIVTDYARIARSSSGRMVRASLGILFWIYMAIGCVVSVVQSKWALAAVYGVVALTLPSLALIGASVIDHSADPE